MGRSYRRSQGTDHGEGVRWVREPVLRLPVEWRAAAVKIGLAQATQRDPATPSKVFDNIVRRATTIHVREKCRKASGLPNLPATFQIISQAAHTASPCR